MELLLYFTLFCFLSANMILARSCFQKTVELEQITAVLTLIGMSRLERYSFRKTLTELELKIAPN